MNEADEAITRGSGNVFADLGYADAEERQTKLRLAHAINGVIARRRLTQAATAEKLTILDPLRMLLRHHQHGVGGGDDDDAVQADDGGEHGRLGTD
jgi:hypothetical protein